MAFLVPAAKFLGASVGGYLLSDMIAQSGGDPERAMRRKQIDDASARQQALGTLARRQRSVEEQQRTRRRRAGGPETMELIEAFLEMNAMGGLYSPDEDRTEGAVAIREMLDKGGGPGFSDRIVGGALKGEVPFRYRVLGSPQPTPVT